MVGKYVVRAAELAGLTLTASGGQSHTDEANMKTLARSPRAPASPNAARSPASRTPIEAVRAGTMVIVVDDEDRENEGDLTIAAEKVTPEAINFMARYGRGLICLSMTPERLDELEIPLMVRDNTSRFETAFCTPIDAMRPDDDRHLGARSRGDRARGDRSGDAAGGPRAARHMFIRCARASGGVLVRAGQTEAAVDLARIAGLYPGRRHLRNHERGRHDGARAGADEVREEARAADDHDRGSDQVPDAHRVARQAGGRRRSCRPSTASSACIAFENVIDQQTHIALVCGDIGDGKDVLVRVHSQCLTGDVLHSIRCDCGAQLETAMQRIAAEGRGVLLYLQPGRPRHRPREQDSRLRAAGRRLRHGRGQRAARLQGRSARLRHGRADSARARHPLDAAAEQQSAQAGRDRRLRPVGRPNGCRSRFPRRTRPAGISRRRRTSSATSCRPSESGSGHRCSIGQCSRSPKQCSLT